MARFRLTRNKSGTSAMYASEHGYGGLSDFSGLGFPCQVPLFRGRELVQSHSIIFLVSHSTSPRSRIYPLVIASLLLPHAAILPDERGLEKSGETGEVGRLGQQTNFPSSICLPHRVGQDALSEPMQHAGESWSQGKNEDGEGARTAGGPIKADEHATARESRIPNGHNDRQNGLLQVLYHLHRCRVPSWSIFSNGV